MKNLPSDLATLRALHQTVENYLAALNTEIATLKSEIHDNELCVELGERSRDLVFPVRNFKTTPPEPPQLVAEYGIASDSLLEAMDFLKKHPQSTSDLLRDDSLSNDDLVTVLRDSLRLPLGLKDTYTDLGNRILDAIDAVTEGREIQHGPPRPAFKLTGKLQDLLFAIWQRADWQNFPPIARKDAIIEDVWGVDGTSRNLDVALGRLNDAINEQRGGLSFHSHKHSWVMIDIHQK
jgi:hypothetical protein